MMHRLYYIRAALVLGFLGAIYGFWRNADTVPLKCVPPAPERTLIMMDGSCRKLDNQGGRSGPLAARVARPSSPSEVVKTTHPGLRVVMDQGCDLPLRLATVKQVFAQPLSQPELGEVLAYLVSPLADDLPAAERERDLRNQMLNALRRDVRYAAVAVPELVSQAADKEQDEGLRDYALQHLAAWVPNLPPAERAAALGALKAALKNPLGTYAGTALLGLHDLAQGNNLDPDFDINREARRILLDEKYTIESRLSALTLVAERPAADPAVEALARDWLGASYLPLGARLAAEAFLRKNASL